MKGIIIAAFCFVQLLCGFEAKAGNLKQFPTIRTQVLLMPDTISEAIRSEYRNARQTKNLALAIGLPVGICTFWGGFYLLSEGMDKPQQVQLGLTTMLVGGLISTVVVPVLRHKSKRTIRELETTYPGISLKASSNGVGLALVF